MAQITPTAAEAGAFEWIYSRLDPSGRGFVNLSECRGLFQASSLREEIIGGIVHLVDERGEGRLNKSTFFLALRLISQAQQGVRPDVGVASSATDIPVAQFQGIHPPSAGPSSPVMTPTSASSPVQLPPPSKETVDLLLAQFQELGPQNGKLNSDSARQFLLRSQLPMPVLSRIWILSDTDSDGALTNVEFLLAMSLAQVAQRGAPLPPSIPPSYIESLRQLAGSGPMPKMPPTLSPVSSPVMRPATTFAPSSPRLTTTFAPTSPRLAPISPAIAVGGAPWAVTPEEQSRYFTIFDKTDAQRKGFLTGQEVQALMAMTGLPTQTLAQIWTLADVTQAGVLNREELAVALKLVYIALEGGQMPAALPPNWIPPSRRGALPVAAMPGAMPVGAMPGMMPGGIPGVMPGAVPGAVPGVPEDPATAEARAPLLALRKEIEEAKVKTASLQSEAYELMLRRTNAENDRKAAQTEYDSLELQHTSARGELEHERPLMEELENTVKKERDEMQRLHEEYMELEKRARNVEQSKGAALQNELERARELDDLTQAFRKAENMVLMTTKELETLVAEKKRLKAEADSLQTKLGKFGDDAFADFDDSFSSVKA